MEQVIKALASVSHSVSQSVSVVAPMAAIFIRFSWTFEVVRGLKSKIEFVWGENPMTLFPILPQFLPP